MTRAITVTDQLRHLLYTYDRDLPIDAETHALSRSDGLTVERFTYQGAYEARVPGVLTYGAAPARPRPALIIQHGLNAGKDDERLALLRSVWAAQGFACMTIDAPYHGERADAPLDVLALFARPYSGLHFVQQTVIDLRRAVDYLVARSDVDAQRIGYVGFSMSTFLGVQFVAVEPRVRAACLAMGGAGLFHFLVSRAPEGEREDQELVAQLVDPLHYAPLITPRPVLQVNGTADEVVPVALGHMLHGALQEPKQIIWYPGRHGELPDDTVARMRAFLTDVLDVETASERGDAS